MSAAKWEDQLARIFVPPPGVPIMDLTDEWFRARRGRITASTRAHIIAQGRDYEWQKLRTELRAELQPDYISTPFSNEATQWGHDHEDEALANIELETGLVLYKPGLIIHDELTYAGASPDGHTDGPITVQIKCPFNPKYHLETVHSRRIPTKYFHQCQFESFVGRRSRILFASYDPRQPLATRLALIWMEADPLLHQLFDRRLREFYDFFHSGVSVAKLTAVDGIPNIFGRRKA
jgi:hypothetical protein